MIQASPHPDNQPEPSTKVRNSNPSSPVHAVSIEELIAQLESQGKSGSETGFN